MEQNPLILVALITVFAAVLGGAAAHYHRGRGMILTGAIIGLAGGAAISALLLYASAVLVPLAVFGVIAVALIGWFLS